MMYINTLALSWTWEKVHDVKRSSQRISAMRKPSFAGSPDSHSRQACQSNVLVVGACGYSPEALHHVIACQPQVVLLDSFGVGLAQPHLLHQIRESLASTSTIMVGMEPKEENFLIAVREGAAGYVLREASAAEVLSAIRAVAAGEAVCPPCFSATLFRCASQQLAIRQNLRTRSRHGLSRREQQLVELLCFGLTNKEIAGRSISPNTQ
jgi:DNA-binding NarL/FixJ family response regulator